MHDYDLNTACHKCFTRVSDKAKFCHSCGTDIATEDSIGNITDKACPGCNQEHFLHTRKFRPDHPAILECNHCVGIWLTNDYFEKVMKDAVSAGENALKLEQVQPNKLETSTENTSFSYRKCPDCDQFMARENFARHSGVIIDSCKQHGKWFDSEELSRILTWVQAGGMVKSTKIMLSEQQAKPSKQKAKLAQERQSLANQRSHPKHTYNTGGGFGLALVLLDQLFK
ncbi:hypothetical protein DKT75_18125 [Leucothrix arctica]|uniref:Transcription factor zinc-finger domain-containing protein n=2 Tax=Leucothrix arctica TaxID=1481894 RepID=A0A317C5G4_9GAMM|nr:hypothetical protein DKT75_18125 [Leucothrix arctica]